MSPARFQASLSLSLCLSLGRLIMLEPLLRSLLLKLFMGAMLEPVSGALAWKTSTARSESHICGLLLRSQVNVCSTACLNHGPVVCAPNLESLFSDDIPQTTRGPYFEPHLNEGKERNAQMGVSKYQGP